MTLLAHAPAPPLADTPANSAFGVLWTEKYRPQRLEEVALDDETRSLLTQYVTAGELPHLLLAGPPGSGKTTLARILTSSVDCRVLSLNASADRGIDTVRALIGEFARASLGTRWNIVFLDEADQLTADAQTALRNTMETYSALTRFLLTANNLHKIIGPVQSRCQLLTVASPPPKERYRILMHVLKSENIEAPAPQVTLAYVERYPDLRKLLWAVQRAVWTSGGGATLPPLASSAPTIGADLYAAIIANDYRACRAAAASGSFDAQALLREAFWAVPDEHQRAGQLRHIIGKGVHETAFTPDPVILFLSVMAEAIEAVKA